MAKRRLLAPKFEAADKGKFTGRVGHTRTGACPVKGRCTCPRRRTR